MGDRSNINFITGKTEIGGFTVYSVVNLYLHSGGTEAQLKALAIAALNHDREDDASYYTNRIIRNTTVGTEDGLGAGVDARSVTSLNEAYRQQADNEHDILTFDLINQQVAIYDTYNGHLIATFTFSDHDLERAAEVLRNRSVFW